MSTVRLVAEENEYAAEPAPAAPAPQFSYEELAAARMQLDQMMGIIPAPAPAAPAAPAAPKVVVKRTLPDREIVATMAALGSVLTVRLMLLLAVLGAFALAWQAMTGSSTAAIWILGVYALTIVAPLVWLSTKRT